MTPTHAGGSSALALRVLSVCMGVFFLFMSLDKTSWFADPGLLTTQLRGWHGEASAPSQWYLETVAIPGAPVFARIVPVGELAVGVALIAGIQVRLAAVAGLFMVLNFHFAMGVLLRYSYLWNGYGPPVLGSLMALAIGGARLPFSITSRRAR